MTTFDAAPPPFVMFPATKAPRQLLASGRGAGDGTPHLSSEILRVWLKALLPVTVATAAMPAAVSSGNTKRVFN